MSKKHENLDSLVSEFIEVVHSSTAEERENLADYLENTYLKMKTQRAKVFVKQMINYARPRKDENHEQKN